MTLEQVAERMNTTAGQISRLESGERRMTWDWATRLAAVSDINPADLMFGGESPTVPVVGYVGGGAEVYPVDDHERGAGIEEVSCPRGLNPASTVAVMVRGDSMLPIQDGWLLFYSRASELTGSEILGQLCVVQLADEGPTYVKRVIRGQTIGRYILVSTNAAPMEDVELEWAAKVRAILPPEAESAA